VKQGGGATEESDLQDGVEEGRDGGRDGERKGLTEVGKDM